MLAHISSSDYWSRLKICVTATFTISSDVEKWLWEKVWAREIISEKIRVERKGNVNENEKYEIKRDIKYKIEKKEKAEERFEKTS